MAKQTNHRADFLDLLDSHGGPGFEELVADKVRGFFLNYSSDLQTDKLGNLIAVIPGESSQKFEGKRPRVMLSAHMDEIALIVTEIEEGGYLRMWQAGGFDPRTLLGQEVVVHGKQTLHGIIGSKPPHLTKPAEQQKAAPLEDLFIDLAMPEEQVRSLIQVGDRITLYRESMELLNERISAKALDDRSSIAVILECLRFLRQMRHQADVYAVATVQEEVGVRGAIPAAYRIEPDIAIAIDVSFADMPGQAPDDSFKIGNGPIVEFGPNIHPKVFEMLSDMANIHQIPFQIEFSQGPTPTDASAFQVSRTGIATGLVGTAIRYMHTSVETGSYEDVVNCGRLLAHFIASIDQSVVEGLACY